MRFFFILLVFFVPSQAVFAQGVDTSKGSVFAASLVAGPMVQDASLRGGGSLFAGRAKGGLFAQVTPGLAARGDAGGGDVGAGLRLRTPELAPPGGAAVARLRDLIASAEAGRAGYDAVQYGARVKPPRRPTALTLAEIEAWTRATPGQPHAIGRYQFIPVTLRRLVKDLGAPPEAEFSPALQDQLADLLLTEAGLSAFLSGVMPRRTFMNNLAKIWAGLPNDTGRSHYHGYAGNKAVLSWVDFDAGMVAIFGAGRAAG